MLLLTGSSLYLSGDQGIFFASEFSYVLCDIKTERVDVWIFHPSQIVWLTLIAGIALGTCFCFLVFYLLFLFHAAAYLLWFSISDWLPLCPVGGSLFQFCILKSWLWWDQGGRLTLAPHMWQHCSSQKMLMVTDILLLQIDWCALLQMQSTYYLISQIPNNFHQNICRYLQVRVSP